MQPGVSAAQLARENDINDNLLFNWQRLYPQGLLGAPAATPALLPVDADPDRQTRKAAGPLNRRPGGVAALRHRPHPGLACEPVARSAAVENRSHCCIRSDLT